MMHIDATDKQEILRALTGIIPSDISLEQARDERLRKHESNDCEESPQA